MKESKTISSTATRRQFLRTCGLMGLGLAAGQCRPLSGSCGRAADRESIAVTRTMPLMGTFVSITAVHDSRDLGEEAVGRAFEEMERLIRVFDRHRGDTAVSVLNRDGRVSGAPTELSTVVERSLSLHTLSEGAFDPTVAPSWKPFATAPPKASAWTSRRPRWAELLVLVSARQVSSHDGRITLGRQGMAVTLDGIAKG